ncbi:hypothetical protein SADUNF_Sadunf02G0158300 [Salix dunnii]|uniref:Uncharacterized protein n=1 Tax=Salix dunnii TaxID=1413687 RepID=A0A835THP4_9ROSI|nr:hypothetical protein SADUNF_Sadunf02G0158300 [Salix dunnii]
MLSTLFVKPNLQNIDSNPVLAYMKTYGHGCREKVGCGQASVYELDKIPNGKQIEKALVQQLGCQPSVPAVFIAQEFVGGDKEVMSLQVRNELGPLLMKAGAIWI